MTVEVQAPPAPATGSPWATASFAQRGRRRRLLLSVLVAFLAVSIPFGFPTGREVITGWILLVLWAACAGERRIWTKVVVRDWPKVEKEILLSFRSDLLPNLLVKNMTALIQERLK